MTSTAEHTGALEALDRILNRGGDADDVLREVVALLHDRFERYSRVGIYLVEGDDLVLGPWAGQGIPATRSEVVVPIAYEGRVVGEIHVDPDEPAALGEADRAFLERVALLVSPHCLVGWDTGGERWSP